MGETFIDAPAEAPVAATAVDSAPPPTSGGSRIDLAGAILVVFALTGFIIGAREIADNSFLTHLATGRLIIDQHAVPTADPYSYLASGEPWTVQSWLPSLLYAVLDSTLGGWSIRILHGLITSAVVVGLWRLVAPVRQLVPRVALVGLVMLIGTFLWPPRPLLFGLVGIVAVLQVAQGMRPRWWLIPVFWVWVNSHGSFLLGLVLLGTIMVGAAIDDRRWLPPAEIRTLAAAIVGCLVGAVNPLTWRLLWFPFHMLTRRDALERVAEWTSPSFRQPLEQLFLLLLPLIVLAAARRAPWRVLLPSIVFFVSGLMAVRNLGLASLVIVALVAPSLAGLAGTLDGSTTGRVPRMLAMVAGAGFVVAALAVAMSSPVDVEDYPIDELDWLEDRALVADEDVRLVQRDFVGNFMTLRYGSDARVFMDDRFDFYPQTVIDDHNTLLLGGDMGEIMERNEFDVVLWATESPLHRWVIASDDWRIMSDEEPWFVACRTTSSSFTRCLAD